MLIDNKQPIAFFVPVLQGGGAQRVVVNLANALPDMIENPVHVVVVRKDGQLVDELRSDVQVVDLGTKKTSRSILSLAKYMRRQRPKAMISTLDYANVVFLISGLLAGRPCPLIVREANVVRQPSGSLGTKVRKYIIQWLRRRLYPFADKVVAICKDVERSMLDAGLHIQHNVVLIGNPVDIETQTNHTDTWGWLPDPAPPFICAIGRLREQKGFDVLLNAFAKLKDKSFHLVILGDGPLRKSLIQQAEELGIKDRVHLPGFVKNAREVLEHSQLFVLSSRWEGFVNVLLEALATGVPIVSTDCPGASKDILESGAHGHLVPYDDPDALAAGITKALQQPAGSLESRMERAADFSSEKIAKQYLDCIC